MGKFKHFIYEMAKISAWNFSFPDVCEFNPRPIADLSKLYKYSIIVNNKNVL